MRRLLGVFIVFFEAHAAKDFEGFLFVNFFVAVLVSEAGFDREPVRPRVVDHHRSLAGGRADEDGA